MNRLFGAATTILAVWSFAAHAQDFPDAWDAFKRSAKPEDRRLATEIPKMQWWDACYAWGREQRQKTRTRRAAALLAYLDAEDLINGVDLGNVRDRTVNVGMTMCGVFAARGKPDAVNQTTNARGTSAQIVYREPKLYVYTEPSDSSRTGIVRSFQH